MLIQKQRQAEWLNQKQMFKLEFFNIIDSIASILDWIYLNSKTLQTFQVFKAIILRKKKLTRAPSGRLA